MLSMHEILGGNRAKCIARLYDDTLMANGIIEIHCATGGSTWRPADLRATRRLLWVELTHEPPDLQQD